MTEDVVLPASSGMTWSIKESFQAYLLASGGEVSVDGGAAASPEGVASWPLADAAGFDAAAGAGTLRFAGRVRYTGYFGAMDIDLASPALTLDGDAAVLTIGEPARPLAHFTAERADSVPGYTAWICHGGRLDVAALPLFGGAYNATTELDPLIVALADEAT